MCHPSLEKKSSTGKKIGVRKKPWEGSADNRQEDPLITGPGMLLNKRKRGKKIMRCGVAKGKGA